MEFSKDYQKHQYLWIWNKKYDKILTFGFFLIIVFYKNMDQDYIVEYVVKSYKNKKDKEFLKRFLKTQIAISHIEQIYKL